jgi:hypothetical protein
MGQINNFGNTPTTFHQSLTICTQIQVRNGFAGTKAPLLQEVGPAESGRGTG